MTQHLAQGVHRAKDDGYIIPGLTAAEFGPLRTALRDRGTAPIAFVTPPSSSAQTASACQGTKGSIYCSVTGICDATLVDPSTWLKRDRLHTALPIELESAISRRQNVEAVERVAVAVFVSSRLIAETDSVLSEECVIMASEFVPRLLGSTRGPT